MKAITRAISAGTCAVLLLVVLSPQMIYAQQSEAPDATAWQEMVDRAIVYLRDQGQADNGSFSAQAGPGVTALVATGLMNVHLPPTDPVVAGALDYVKSFVKPDGGVYVTDAAEVFRPKAEHRGIEPDGFAGPAP